jgi:hypothetical protein
METNRPRLALFKQIQKKNAAIEGAETGEKSCFFMGDSITEFWSNASRILSGKILYQ